MYYKAQDHCSLCKTNQVKVGDKVYLIAHDKVSYGYIREIAERDETIHGRSRGLVTVYFPELRSVGSGYHLCDFHPTFKAAANELRLNMQELYRL